MNAIFYELQFFRQIVGNWHLKNQVMYEVIQTSSVFFFAAHTITSIQRYISIEIDRNTILWTYKNSKNWINPSILPTPKKSIVVYVHPACPSNALNLKAQDGFEEGLHLHDQTLTIKLHLPSHIIKRRFELISKKLEKYHLRLCELQADKLTDH